MNNEKKDILIDILYKISFSIFGLCIIIGALIGGPDDSILVGAFGGFMIGIGVLILNAIIVRSIENPYLLLAFVILPTIGFLIGLIWGLGGAKIGAGIGVVLAILIVADMIKKK